MSIICTTYTSDAIIMAADSRVLINMNYQNKDDASKNFTHIFPMSDNVEKLFLLNKVQVGIAASGGLSSVGTQTIAQFMREFEKEAVRETDSVFDVADKLRERMTGAGSATYHVAGYDGGEPFFYSVSAKDCKRLNVQNAELQYGITWSGEVAALQKLMMGEPKPAIDFKSMSALDAAEFTELLIDTAIKLQKYELKPKTCGGAIDVLMLTADGAIWHKHKFLERSFKEIPRNQRSGNYVTDANGNTIN